MRDAPQQLNTNDRAMWLVGWQECWGLFCHLNPLQPKPQSGPVPKTDAELEDLYVRLGGKPTNPTINETKVPPWKHRCGQE